MYTIITKNYIVIGENMQFKKYYISDSEGKSNCVIRTCCKLFNEEYFNVKKELSDVASKLGYDNYTEVDVFESYLYNKDYSCIDCIPDIKIRNLELPIGKYAIFCYDKKNFYHMISIIDNVIYDRSDDCLDLFVIKVYKKDDRK